MKAETQAMRAKVVEAEAQIPQAIAEAFRAGHLGVMDYYKLNNVKADTEMRGAIGSSVGGDGSAAAARPARTRPRSDRTRLVHLAIVAVVGDRGAAGRRGGRARSAAAPRSAPQPRLPRGRRAALGRRARGAGVAPRDAAVAGRRDGRGAQPPRTRGRGAARIAAHRRPPGAPSAVPRSQPQSGGSPVRPCRAVSRSRSAERSPTRRTPATPSSWPRCSRRRSRCGDNFAPPGGRCSG